MGRCTADGADTPLPYVRSSLPDEVFIEVKWTELSHACQVQGCKLPQDVNKFISLGPSKVVNKVADPMAETNFFQEENGEFHKTLMKTYSASNLSQIQIFLVSILQGVIASTVLRDSPPLLSIHGV